jgi:hypothetical protein
MVPQMRPTNWNITATEDNARTRNVALKMDKAFLFQVISFLVIGSPSKQNVSVPDNEMGQLRYICSEMATNSDISQSIVSFSLYLTMLSQQHRLHGMECKKMMNDEQGRM